MPAAAGLLYFKPGAPGIDDPAYAMLAAHVEPRGKLAIDLNPGVGISLSPLLHAGMEVHAWEDRRSALRALEASASHLSNLKVVADLPWNAPTSAYDIALLVFGADRGNSWVRSQIDAASRALKPGGLLWVAGNKKTGFERYLKWARSAVGPGEIIARDKGLRVAILEHTQDPAPPVRDKPGLIRSRLRGEMFEFVAWPGVFSADSIDPASALLLEHLPRDFRGTDVLDLGAGYGALSLPLAHEGATVTLLENQLASVESARASFDRAGMAANIFHSDLDEALQKGAVYDTVISNPPFHLGGRVVLEVSEAFVAAAHLRTRPGGRFYLVANPFLKYEDWMRDRFGNVQILHASRYKVLLSVKNP